MIKNDLCVTYQCHIYCRFTWSFSWQDEVGDTLLYSMSPFMYPSHLSKNLLSVELMCPSSVSK
jgi:hypothetical protein